MAYFCDPDIPMYQTRGVAEDIHPFIVTKCLEMLDVLKKTIAEPDYLQVYRLTYMEQGNVLHVVHTQEEPDYRNEISFVLPNGVKPYEGKLYYIDDGDHRTVLKAEEY